MTTISLTHPIQFEGKTLNTLNLRRLKIGDIRAAKAAPDLIEAAVIVAARLAGVTVEALDELDAADTEALFDSVNQQLAAFKH